MSILIDKSEWIGPTLKGQLKLPIASNLIGYSGSFNQQDNDIPTIVTDELPKTLDMPMWKGNFIVEKESKEGCVQRNE